MTTEQKIKIMEAFERGEPIEYAPIYNGKQGVWKDTRVPRWNWEDKAYRIKQPEPPKEPKFKIGDKIIIKTRCNGAIINPADIMNITEITEEYYKDEASVCLIISFADEEFIHIDECLWFWEYKTSSGTMGLLERRYSKTVLDKSPYTHDCYIPEIAPIYQLGARLPEEKKNERD
ncbi:hypothetical protein A9K75_07780 [Campylobacter fetus subsp. testudinum]|uniref:hypothetical protein n=1 Tax=Campylobacter fetus TaxID=196 RepID=UPI000818AF9B|nr:hypothetical protein [Campylobacter fetus]OCR99218.1 hypothetical protein A9K75_07780 [Campylobacter fetus subsp. testudinum]